MIVKEFMIDNTKILIESVEVEEIDGLHDVAGIIPDFDMMVNIVKKVGSKVQTALEKISPDKTVMEFNISIEAGTGIPMITSGKTSGAFKIAMEWSKKNNNEQRTTSNNPI